MRNTVTCFGVGDGWSCADRGHASFQYRLGGQSLLVDCGEPIDGRLAGSGLGHDSFDAVFLSHLHADHFGGLFMLLQGCWLERRRKALPVFLPSSGVRPLRSMLRAAYLFDELLRFKLTLNPLRPRKPVRVGAARVTPYPTTHLEAFKRRFNTRYRVGYESYAFLIEAAGIRVAHTADIGKPEDLLPLLEHRIDLLVCELAHFRCDDLFDLLKGKAIGKVVFMHLNREYWKNLPRVRRQAAQRLGRIPHTFAVDGAVIGF
jgi:ribonuclease BN (tRNA processing enzyme)